MNEHRMGSSAAVIALVLVAGLIIGGLATSYVFLQKIDSLENDVSNLSSTLSRMSGNQTNLYQTINLFWNTTALNELYGKVKDSVVLIEGQTSTGTVQGSGFVYNMTGSLLVVTNNHVVHGTTSLSVTFSNGDGYAATVNGTDPYADLAVVSVVGAPEDEFKPIAVASSSTLRVGDSVVAIGAPFGLAGSMTTGVISGLGRTITETEYAGGFAIADIIQTSTPVNPGNSGGPLLDLDGEVVGITAATAEVSQGTPAQGVVFAVESNTILRELGSLVATGHYDGHSYLGVGTTADRGGDMDYFQAQTLHTNVTYGWWIGEVVSGGPADKAGVHVDDILVGINQTRIKNGDEMSSYLEEYTLPTENVTLHLVRSNQDLDLLLTLGTRPPPPS
ncbi:MAG: trypsin-like peptidase domain-containing protein [Candidatus Bathyarchaeia archaeon]|jgi:S1-C subfamily serine protease